MNLFGLRQRTYIRSSPEPASPPFRGSNYIPRRLGAKLGLKAREAEAVGLLGLLRRIADGKAHELGHVLTPWEDDDEGSTVASCRRCGAYAVADPLEQPMIFGRGTRERCQQ